MNTEKVRKDFDEIARLSDCHGVGADRYDSFLLSLVPIELVIHDILSDAGLGEWILSNFALAQVAALRLLRTGRLRSPRAVREAWARHCADEKYLTQREVEALAARLLPGARLFYHWLWSYTIVWDKPRALQPY